MQTGLSTLAHLAGESCEKCVILPDFFQFIPHFVDTNLEITLTISKDRS